MNNTSWKVIKYKNISLLRGVKQGCPLSLYLFIIAIEILAIKIRSNKNIKGLEMFDLDMKVSMYADDSNFFLCPQLSSLELPPWQII